MEILCSELVCHLIWLATEACAEASANFSHGILGESIHLLFFPGIRQRSELEAGKNMKIKQVWQQAMLKSLLSRAQFMPIKEL